MGGLHAGEVRAECNLFMMFFCPEACMRRLGKEHGNLGGGCVAATPVHENGLEGIKRTPEEDTKSQGICDGASAGSSEATQCMASSSPL